MSAASVLAVAFAVLAFLLVAVLAIAAIYHALTA